MLIHAEKGLRSFFPGRACLGPRGCPDAKLELDNVGFSFMRAQLTAGLDEMGIQPQFPHTKKQPSSTFISLLQSSLATLASSKLPVTFGYRLGPSLTAPRIPLSCVMFLFLALGGVLDEQHGNSGCLGNNTPEFQPQLSSVPAAES